MLGLAEQTVDGVGEKPFLRHRHRRRPGALEQVAVVAEAS